MTAHNDLDRQLNDLLRDGPTELPYQSYDAVRDRTEQTGQRVVLGPWRLPEMNKIVTLGLGVAAVALAVFLGAQLLSSPSGRVGSGGGPTAEPTGTPEPTVTPEAAPSPPASAAPLTQSFTSTQHGISVSYPDGWTVRAATEPWTESTYSLRASSGTPYIDFLFHPTLTENLFLNMASQPIGDATPEEWMAAQVAEEAEECTATEPIAVDGASGLIGADGCDIVVVTTAGRGYHIGLHTSDDDPVAVAPYDRAWFEAVLATVQLHPEDAAD
jgi:hypothetical protein